MRPSTLAFSLLSALFLAMAVCLVDAGAGSERHADDVAAMRTMVERYDLSDLALFTEARYTRHPSQADLHSAFQDHPLAFEHFPSGSLIPPRHDFLADKATAPD
jgi:hypothetical protein